MYDLCIDSSIFENLDIDTEYDENIAFILEEVEPSS